MLYITIIMLTLADIFFSIMGLNTGVIVEANPIMRYLIDLSMTASAVLAALFVAGAMFLCYRFRDRIKWLRYALIFLLAVKVAVIGMHMNWILRI